MKPLKIRNMIIGEGVTKICTPLISKTEAELLSEAKTILMLPVDIVEWRADWFENVDQIELVKEVLLKLRSILNEVPILFTIRTFSEGGARFIEPKQYEMLNTFIASSGLVDIIDVELFTGDEIVTRIVESAHASGTKVILSNHDFLKTPSREVLRARLFKMEQMNADILKIAVMPTCKADVLNLLEVTLLMSEKYTEKPIVTMSMGNMGVISRLTGEFFGSSISFGAANKISAPGQIEVKKLSEILLDIHSVIK